MRCLATLFLVALALPAQETTPTLPDSPLKALASEFLSKAATATPDRAQLLRPELSFKPRRRWLLLPELAKQLGSDDAQRAAVLQILEAGATEVRKQLAKEGADNDVGAAAALFISELWKFARQKELPEAHVDALHAQVVAVLATPEVAAMTYPEKQRFWEFCVAYPIFVAGMNELAESDEQRSKLRQAADLGFAALLGVDTQAVDIGGKGLVARKGKPARRTTPTSETPAAKPAVPLPGGAAALPAKGPAIRGVTYTPPTGWAREVRDGNILFRATLGDVTNEGKPEANNSAQHQATIGVLPVLTATAGPTALFDKTWREQFGAFELGDTFVHYRGRLPSNLVVLYMGRFFSRPNHPNTNNNPKTYGVLYLVDLGANRFQPLVAVVEPRDNSLGMDMFRESSALRALSFPLWAMLQSVKPEKGEPPYPAGGFFAAQDLIGRWSQSSSAFGGHYYNSNTGGYAGAAVHSAGGHFYLEPDGSYEYAFAYATSHPQFGNSRGSTKHSGTYRLDGDVVLVTPSQPINYEFTACAVGIGVRNTPDGPRRVLVTVDRHRDGGYRSVSLIPNWDNYNDGVLSWYVAER